MTSKPGLSFFKNIATPKQRSLEQIAENAAKVVGLRDRQNREQVHSQCFVAKDLAMWLKQSLVRCDALCLTLPCRLVIPSMRQWNSAMKWYRKRSSLTFPGRMCHSPSLRTFSGSWTKAGSTTTAKNLQKTLRPRNRGKSFQPSLGRVT